MKADRHHEQPEIVRTAARVRAVLEEAVPRFKRRHRHTLGARLADSAESIHLHLYRAWHIKARRITEAQQASDEIDRLKLRIQLAQDVQAFVSLDQCEMVGRLVEELGRQCGGWLNGLRNKGQNAPDQNRAQRATTLSSRAASSEAHP